MAHQEIVIYKRALAYYTIKQEGSKSVVAELQHYEGVQSDRPPRKVVYLQGNTNHCTLIEDVCKAIGKPI